MCPACIGSAAFIAASLIPAGGVAAVFVRKFVAKNLRAKKLNQTKNKERHDG